jgi:hypothetical protein
METSMKLLIAIFCLAGTVAHANPYYDREAEVEAQEKTRGRAQAEQTEAAAQKRLYGSVVQMANGQGGLTNYAINVSLIGNTLIQGGEMYFVTGNNMVCHPILFNTLCRDESCSSARFGPINCIDSSGARLKLDLNGKRHPWPTLNDIWDRRHAKAR